MKHLGKLAAGVALALMFCGAVSAKQSALDVSLAPTGEKSDAGSAKLRYTISNFGTVDLLVLSWETPLRGVEDDLFEVQRGGRAVEYVGRHFKRGLPQAGDYIELKAGQSLSVDVDLSDYYDMTEKGYYATQAIAHFHDTFAVRAENGDEKLAPLSDRDLRSETVHQWVDSADVPYLPQMDSPFNFTKSVNFANCSSGQENSITSGVNAAQNMAADANAYLAANKTGSRYTTWFGGCS